jgi:hypothetical protein
MTRDQLSLPHLQWFTRHLGNKNRASTVINSDIQKLLIRTNHGEVKLDANDLDSSVFDLTIDPADENCGHALNAEGMLPTGYIPDTFAARRVDQTTIVLDLKLLQASYQASAETLLAVGTSR